MGLVTSSGAGPPVAGENLMPLYSGGIVAGGDVDAPGPAARPDGEAHHRGGAVPVGEIADNAVAGHHFGGGGGKGLGPEAGVVADDHPWEARPSCLR